MSARPLLTFGAFTDLHAADAIVGDRHCRDARVKLRAAVADFTARRLPLAICLGDLIDTGPSPAAERQMLADLCADFAAFPGARHVLLGNHDVAALSKADVRAACGLPAAPYYAVTIAGVRLIVLDGNNNADGSDYDTGNFSWDNAWLSPPQLAWLADELAASRDLPTLVFCHENIDHHDWQGAPDPHVLRNAAALRTLLHEAKHVRAVIQGHYHPGRVTVQDGLPYITLTAMVTGPGVANNAYAVITLFEDGSIAVEGMGRQASAICAPRA